MEKTHTYFTLEFPSESLYKEKGSKFFGYAFPVFEEEEIKEKLTEIRKLHPTARHHCYGYRLGIGTKERYRANDDGEPSNSAGKPIYGQLLSSGITNVLIVVVRYFGGTKLGVGGLISAYKIAANEAIKTGKIIRKEVLEYYIVKFEYQNMSKVMSFVKQNKIEITSQEFEMNCQINISLIQQKTPLLISFIENAEGVEIEFLGRK